MYVYGGNVLLRCTMQLLTISAIPFWDPKPYPAGMPTSRALLLLKGAATTAMSRSPKGHVATRMLLVCALIYKEQGLRGFYTGLLPNMLQVRNSGPGKFHDAVVSVCAVR